MKRVTVSVPEEVDARVREWAKEEETSLSQIYADAVAAYIQEKRRQRAAERVETILDRTTVQPGAVEALHAERDASDRSFPQSQ
jgi:metal-responsive CopG/Arc/MetJ family transcriptional regulator